MPKIAYCSITGGQADCQDITSVDNVPFELLSRQVQIHHAAWRGLDHSTHAWAFATDACKLTGPHNPFAVQAASDCCVWDA